MNEKITAVLVDDEENSRKVLSTLLQKFCPEVLITGEAENADNAFTLIQSVRPELIFLDVQMPVKNGFSLLSMFAHLPFEVIFITGYDQYAINAIRFSALDYLLKPVEVQDLVNAVAKAVQKKQTGIQSQPQVVHLLNNIVQSQSLMVHSGEKVLLIELNNVCFIEADGRYCYLYTITGEKHIITRTLKEFEDFFIGHASFVRINKNTIINIHYIRSYSKGEPCIIEMHDSREFDISRRKKQEVLEQLKKH